MNMLVKLPRHPMFRMLLIVAVVISLLAGVKWWQISQAMAQQAHMGPPPTAVTSLVTSEAVWQGEIDLVGSFEATQGVNVSAEEDGKVAKIGFESGAVVKSGALLVQLDTAVEEAQLKSAEADATLAQINLTRALKLRGNNANSEADLNNAVAKAKAASGQVEMIKAMIARKNIVAPFDGVAGIRMVQLGQYVSRGQPIAPVFAFDPIYVNFSIPQQQLAQVNIGQKIVANVDAFPDRAFEGSVSAMDPQVQTDTRHVRVQATVPNRDGALRPGMFVNVAVILNSQSSVIAIPGTSVNYAPYGNSVYVIERKAEEGTEGSERKEKLVVRQQLIKLGPSRGDQVAVIEGLKPGEEIVTSGIFKLRPGAEVFVNNSVQPSNNPQPVPADT